MEEKIVIRHLKDVPIVSISLQPVLWNRTGAWRNLRPSYVDLQAPCSKACPLEQDISFYLTSIADGETEKAWERMVDTNPFPSVCGRVCHHPCETNCNRKGYDGALAIHALERFLGDWAMRNAGGRGRRVERRKEKIAIIGSGPAGLSCAYFLALKGYRVKVIEAMSEPGGMLRYGIPSYRLPKNILNREIERIESLGVEIETGRTFGRDVDLEDFESYSAIFFATGALAEQKLNIPGDELKGVWHGLAFLREINSGKRLPLGERVVVIGGGNTAIDSARVARRLGSTVTLLYRRSKEEMPAIAEEVEAAAEEGVEFVFQAQPVEMIGKGGKVHRIRCLRTKPGEKDSTGRRKPIPMKGSDFSLPANGSIIAVGEQADLSFLPEGVRIHQGLIAVDPWGRTSLPGVFAGGDAATGEGYVSHAIASGRRAAHAIQAHVEGKGFEPAERPRDVVDFKNINLDYFPSLPRTALPTRSPKERAKGFGEVHQGLSESRARKEAERCFGCGNCTRCNICLMVCPDVAISFKDEQYVIDYDYCKGCGLCFVECPRSVIALEEEKWSE